MRKNDSLNRCNSSGRDTRVVSELWKRRFARCFFVRELHGVTVGKSHVSLPWCLRFAAQIISRSHCGTDGMTGYRRAYGRSRIPRRYVPLSEKSILLGAVQEEGLSRGEVARGDFFRNQRRIWDRCGWNDGLLFNSIRGARGNCNLELKGESWTENSWKFRLQFQFQRDKPHRRQSGNSCQDEFTSDDQWIWQVRVHRHMYPVQIC